MVYFFERERIIKKKEILFLVYFSRKNHPNLRGQASQGQASLNQNWFDAIALAKMSEKLCLQWNDFKDNVNCAFRSLRKETDFADVTLACEDGQQV